MGFKQNRILSSFFVSNIAAVVVAACFLVSRVIYYLAGVRFDDFAGVHLMHFLPPDLLRERLFESIFYLHTQPPLFNLFLGFVYTFFPHSHVAAFQAIYLFMGIMLALSMYFLMRRMGAGERIAAILTIIAVISPPWVLFEHILLYEYPTALFLLLAAFFLHRFLERGCGRDGFLFFSFMAMVVFIRSFFHVFWMAGILVLLFLTRGDLRRKTAWAAMAPLILVLALYMKNAYVFGMFSTSSWMGMSLSKMTTQRLSENERVNLTSQGKLSELALIPPFKALWLYGSYGEIPSFKSTGVPVLDLKFFENIGNNWNNAAYLSISRQYAKDALVVIKNHPETYLSGLGYAFSLFFFPSGDWFHIFPARDNVTPLNHWERFFNTVVYGRFVGHIQPGLSADFPAGHFNNSLHMGFFILGMFLISVGWGIRKIIRAFPEKTLHTPAFFTILFMVLTILYVFIVSNALESGENYRFRFDIEPLIFVLFACAISGMAGVSRKKELGEKPAFRRKRGKK